MIKRIAVLTGGGDCPGLNPVIYGIFQKAFQENIELLGFYYGWKGLIENKKKIITPSCVEGILSLGGTILKTSRTNPFFGDSSKVEENLKKIKTTIKENSIDTVIAIGGEDTLGVCYKLFQKGIHCIGVPKTIDNDLESTDYTFGFDTAVNTAMNAIDSLRTTTASHERVMVVEVMGRHAGWLTLYSGLTASADVILIPEKEYDLKEVLQVIRKAYQRKKYSIVCVSEGAIAQNDKMILQASEQDSFGHVRLGGVGEALAKKIENETGFETRCVVLGHLQRGGAPSAFDRMLGLRFGLKAVELSIRKDFGKMVSLNGRKIISVPLKKAIQSLKLVNNDLYEILKVCFSKNY